MQITDTSALNVANLTFEAWFKLDNVEETGTGFPVVAAQGYFNGPNSSPTADSWAVWFQNSQLNAAAMASNTFTGDLYDWAGDTNWHHVAFTFDSSTLLQSLYLDGALVVQQTGQLALMYDGSPVLLGMDVNNGSYSGGWTGDLADVRIWNFVRTSGEIADDPESCVTGTETGLVGAWPLDDGSGATARDLTPATDDGTLDPVSPGGSIPTWVTAAPP